MSTDTATAIADGPRGVPLLGNLPQFARDPLAFFTRLREYPADQVRWTMGRTPARFLCHPELIGELLSSRGTVFEQPDLGFSFKYLMGEGVVTARGADWRRKRAIVQPAVRPRQVRIHAGTMSAVAQQLADRWSGGEHIDIQQEMEGVTQRIAVRTIFGTDAAVDEELIARSMGVAQRQMGAEFRGLGAILPDWVRTPGRIRFKAAVDTLDTEVARLVTARRTSGEDRDDLLSRLLAARDEKGVPLTDREIRDESVTLYNAGHETTATTLTWAWYLISRNEAVRGKLVAELRRELAGRTPDFDDYGRLTYTESVIKETLRIRPTVWLNYAVATEGATLGGEPVEPGTQVWISPWATHLDPRWFPAAQEFRPERWAPDAPDPITDNSWFPFGGGTRACLGARFAMVEAVLVLATLAQRFHLDVDPGDIRPTVGLTLQPDRAVRATVRPL
ncbi:cytochrome P450 [Streptomyces sp. RKAG337]|uniref:cytochrome P450 n=1 Tax=Streptomyces sp. RKAG337 TaxID=2893404 RepID=UPI0020338C27|nr:cytochrome P450 [Streptomyces sp. RKAG337]MCM2429424.1 cytochrome P450 [Streptomyces sp. RKAG337]